MNSLRLDSNAPRHHAAIFLNARRTGGTAAQKMEAVLKPAATKITPAVKRRIAMLAGIESSLALPGETARNQARTTPGIRESIQIGC
jgi:hypothetical protein